MRPSLRPRATSTSRSLATRRLVPTSAGLRSTRLAICCGDAAAVDDGDRVAVDAVAGEAGDLGDGRVEVGEHLQRPVAEHVAPGAGVEHGLHEAPVHHALVAAGDADGDRLGLVLDGVDGPGQLVDRRGSGPARGRRRGRPASRPCPVLAWYSSTGRSDADVAQQAGEVHRRARLEVPVVAVAAQPVDVLLGGPGDPRAHARRARRRPTRSSATRVARSPPSTCAQRAGRRVDGQRGLVAEQVPGHRRQHEPERRVDRRAPGSRWPPAKRSSPSSAMTIGVALWARKIATSLPTSSAVLPARPAAQTRISGSDDRSMCFLSSMTSQAIDL